MGYQTECDYCGDLVEAPALMAQFHEPTWMTADFGGHLKAAGYELGDTITFCGPCTIELLDA